MLLKALPFFVSYTLIPLVVLAVLNGGWWLITPFLWGWVATTALDRIIGLDTSGMDPATRDSLLIWHKLVIWLWVPVQSALMLFVFGHAGALTGPELLIAAAGLGVATGGIGITFAHELIHRPGRAERALGDVLLTSVAYGHFATEHVFGHHLTVGTPADPVSARRGEGFYAFLVRAVAGSARSAWAIERSRLARRGRGLWHRTNPWWRYGAGTLIWAGLAIALGGVWGLAVFGVQAIVAVVQLEAVNYVEHYGLTRRHDGARFERVRPHHSWNASHRVTNWLLVNLQRHSDHHYHPTRRFPLLQHYSWREAPQLPFGYPVMVLAALIPPLWFAIMDRRVQRWRETFYPDIAEWSAYEDGTVGTAAQTGTASAL